MRRHHPEENETGAIFIALRRMRTSLLVLISSFTISISGMYDATVDGYLKGGAEPASRSFEYQPTGTSGESKYTGECILTSYSLSSPVGDVVTFTADFQVTGDVTRGTV